MQKEYAEHLLSILVKRFGMRFQFHFFSNVKKIEQFAEKAEIEILLIAEDCVSEIRGNVKAKKKFILSESMKKEEKQGETTIFRYQSADEILKIIQSGIGEEEAKLHNFLIHQFLNTYGIDAYNAEETFRVLTHEGDMFLKVSDVLGQLCEEAARYKVYITDHDFSEDDEGDL